MYLSRIVSFRNLLALALQMDSLFLSANLSVFHQIMILLNILIMYTNLCQ